MSTFILLIDKYFFNKARDYFLNKYKANKYILFYDSDCGFSRSCRLGIPPNNPNRSIFIE